MNLTGAASEALSARDRHLFGKGRKRILALSGGGVRGIIELAFLERMESLLKTRICDHFDLIGGTSTGAIIATALALGYRPREIREFYLAMGPRVFKKPWLRLPGWQAKFDGEALRRELDRIIGDRTLDSNDLKTGIALVLKRLDAGGAWILSNNRQSRFWETPPDRAFIGNRHYLLARLVRASAAAPSFFDLQTIEIVPGEVGVFVDGGLTSHNDPSLALLLLAAAPGYGLKWALGVDNLTVVSLGTGAYRRRARPEILRRASAFTVALTSLTQQIAESEQLTLTLMSWLGRGGAPWPINLELGDLNAVEPSFGPLFRYLRYDVRLEAEWLQSELDVTVGPAELADLRRFDNPDVLPRLDEIARIAAERKMNAIDFEGA